MATAEQAADHKVIDIAQSNGRWAMLARIGANKSAIIRGDMQEESLMLSPIPFDSLSMTAHGVIYLRHLTQSNRNSTMFSKVDWGSNLLRPVEVPVRQVPAPYTEAGQRTFPFGLPDGGHIVLGDLTEQISVYDAEGALKQVAPADLDSAFLRLGISAAHSDVATGRTRMLWASAAGDKLYVCLSETPVNGPAYIAVLEAATGRFERLIEATLPSLPPRDATTGTSVFMPTMGAAGDRLVIADRGKGIVAVY